MNQQIYWHTTIRMPDESRLTPIPGKVDVAVIGAGYTGLSAALALARRGVTTAVLEAETPGWGASSRNGGMTLTGLKPSLQKLLRMYGREFARDLFRYSLDSLNTVADLVKAENIDCSFARTGHLVVANKPRHFEDLKAQADFLAKEFGHPVRLISKKDLREEIASEAYHGALLDEASGGLNPAQFVVGLAVAAQKAGALVCSRAPVTRCETQGKHIAIETARGSLRAESVLVATSGYTGSVTRSLQKRIIPIGSFIIATEKLDEPLARKLNPNNRMIFDSRRFLNYFRLSDNRMIFGGRAAFFPENENTIRDSAKILAREMTQVHPQLRNAKVEYAWGGTLDFAFDMMPHVGRMDGLYYSLGYAGHGVAMGVHLGRKVAEAILNGSLKEIPFANYPFPTAPLGLYNGHPWFLPIVALWYRFLDLVD